MILLTEQGDLLCRSIVASVELREITKHYDHKAVVDSLSLTVEDSEFAVFVGPSGCGKSTLLRMIAGFEKPDGGEILIDGRPVNDLPPSDRKIAMVFQNYALYPHMSARENLSFCLKNIGTPSDEIFSRVKAVAEMLQIQPLLERKPHQMSGGQRQRVAIGRAIIRNPSVYLFDEPLSNLDALLRSQTRVEIAQLHQKFKTTTIYVTHDQVEAMTLAKRIIVMNAGRIEQVGSPLELYENPRNKFVAGFIGSPQMNFIPAKFESVEGSSIMVRVLPEHSLRAAVTPDGIKPGDTVHLGIRPEHIQVSEGSGLPARVSVIERLGNRTLLYCSIKHPSGLPYPCVVECLETRFRTTALSPGVTVHLSADQSSIHVFSGQGNALPRWKQELARTA